MVTEWQEKTLQEIADIKSGKRLPKGDTLVEYWTEHPYLRLVDVANGRVRKDDLKYLTPNIQNKISKYIVKTNDVCLAIVGHTIGMIFMIDSEFDGANLTENAARITNFRDVDPYYLYSWLNSHVGQTAIANRVVGSAQGKLPLYNIRNLPISLPPLSEQKRIAHILGSLDDKIELNRQMNATLEDMAQALFKSWFVDFDPVIDNALAAGNPIPEAFTARAETRHKALAHGTANRGVAKQFPAAFQFTEEMVWIPEGWEVKTSSSLFDVKDGTHDSPKKSITGKYLITSRHIIGNTIDYSNAYLISEEDFNEVNKRSKVDSYDILLTMIGTVGCPFLVMEEEINFAIKNVGLFKTGINRTLATYFFIYLKSHFMKSFMESRLAGTTQKYLTLKILRALPIIVPHSDIMERFGEQTNSIFNKIHSNNTTTNYLITIRDTLLPKLISGEIRISEAEKLTEEALT